MHLPRSGRRMNKTAIAFGTFDGVHRGHQEIINAMLTAAKRGGLDPLIYTFSNHPAGLFGKLHRYLLSLSRGYAVFGVPGCPWMPAAIF